MSILPSIINFKLSNLLDIELILRFPMTNLRLFLSVRFSKANLGPEEFLSLSLMLWEFQFEDAEPRLLISLTISEDTELSDIKTPILP